MWDDWFYEQLRDATRERAKMPADEWFKDMIRRGILDEKGNVLIRAPQPPGNEEPSLGVPPVAVNGAAAGSETPQPAGACDPRPDSAQ